MLLLMQRSADVVCCDATLRTSPSSGQATTQFLLALWSPCLPLRGSVSQIKTRAVLIIARNAVLSL